MRPLTLDDTVLGQYRARTTGGKTLPGYRDDPTVPAVRSEERLPVARLEPGASSCNQLEFAMRARASNPIDGCVP
jgi:hypothetical protein